MAQVLFIQYLKEKGDDPEKWKVMSAGCWAYPDLPATQYAVQTAEKMGGDLNFHSSKAVSENLLKDFNLILCMESDHKQFIKRNFPEAADNVFLFSEMIGEVFEIDDPVGGTLEAYEHTANMLKEIMHSGFEKIRSLSRK
jgi:protein-tyrosine phosphatase